MTRIIIRSGALLLLLGLALAGCVYQPAPYYAYPGPAYYGAPVVYGPPVVGSVGVVIGDGHHHHWR